MTVVVAHAATIDCRFWEPTFGVTFQGGGEFAAVVLERQDQPLQTPIVFMRLPQGAANAVLATGCSDAQGNLPAGRYRLVVVPGVGNPLTVNLTVGGLSGAASVAPDEPADARVHLQTPSFSLVDGNTIVYSSGDDDVIEGTSGMLMTAAWAPFSIQVGEAIGVCQFDDVEHSPTPPIMAPRCPNGREASFLSTDPFINGVTITWRNTHPVPPARYALGAWHAGPTGIHDGVGHVSLWLGTSADPRSPGLQSTSLGGVIDGHPVLVS
jgi:hypothetical protein